MSYQVGTLTKPKADDPIFDGWADAVELAARLADMDYNAPIVIWDEDCDTQRLYLCGEIFKPA